VTITAVAVALVVGVAGCSASDPDPDPTTTAASTQEPSGEPTSDVVASPAPDGFQLATAPASGFRLALPSEWSAVEIETVMEDPQILALLDDVAARLGASADQLVGAGLDLIAVGADGDNVNVTRPNPGSLTAPGVEGQIRAQLMSAFSANDITISQVTTAVGPAMVASYTASMMGATVHQVQIYQQVTSSEISVITVTHGDLDAAKALADVIVDTLQPRRG